MDSSRRLDSRIDRMCMRFCISRRGKGTVRGTRLLGIRARLLSIWRGGKGEERRLRVEEGEKELGDVCFSCICSFKRDERESFRGHQWVWCKGMVEGGPGGGKFKWGDGTLGGKSPVQ